MFYPEKFKDFVEMTAIFVDAVTSLDKITPEYDSLLSEKADKLKPYIADSHPLLIEYYSTPIDELYKELREEAKKLKKETFSKEEFEHNMSTLLSEEYYDSFIPDDDKQVQILVDECLSDLLACTRLSLMNTKSNIKNNATINQLIDRSSKGDDKSLFLAIMIDPIVEQVPVISERINLAYSLNETVFLNRLNKVRNAKKNDKRIKNQSLDYFLYFYHIAGILNQLTADQKAHIFINELGLYDKDDESLKKYIRRWCKDHNRCLLRIKNLNFKKSRT